MVRVIVHEQKRSGVKKGQKESTSQREGGRVDHDMDSTYSTVHHAPHRQTNISIPMQRHEKSEMRGRGRAGWVTGVWLGA